VKSAAGKEFWTGGFWHELNALWSWCTKDSPESITFTENFITVVTNEGKTKRERTKRDDLNCLTAKYQARSVGLEARDCKASEVYLSCESVEKYPSDLLVRLKQIVKRNLECNFLA
jgi:hypothetical protein